MEKRYRYKATGHIYQSINNNDVYSLMHPSLYRNTIKAKFVEDSNQWEQVFPYAIKLQNMGICYFEHEFKGVSTDAIYINKNNTKIAIQLTDNPQLEAVYWEKDDLHTVDFRYKPDPELLKRFEQLDKLAKSKLIDEYNTLRKKAISHLSSCQLNDHIELGIDPACHHIIDNMIKIEAEYKKLTTPMPQPEYIKKEDVVGLMRDCVSELWGINDFNKVQSQFNEFLKSKGLS